MTVQGLDALIIQSMTIAKATLEVLPLARALAKTAG